ncbi:Ribonuclease HI [Senna tora]|uniref:Ribonuclease HI n=1 Tax=Senna tora TaxID=362788 RepID=A0A834WR71_9FABA|nr:Ribonuclease HI [Senna tora]
MGLFSHLAEALAILERQSALSFWALGILWIVASLNLERSSFDLSTYLAMVGSLTSKLPLSCPTTNCESILTTRSVAPSSNARVKMVTPTPLPFRPAEPSTWTTQWLGATASLLLLLISSFNSGSTFTPSLVIFDESPSFKVMSSKSPSRLGHWKDDSSLISTISVAMTLEEHADCLPFLDGSSFDSRSIVRVIWTKLSRVERRTI